MTSTSSVTPIAKTNCVRATQTPTAAAFVVMGVFVAREAARDAGGDPECACPDDEVSSASPLAKSWQALATTFGLLFVAELGDKTQLAVLSMATKSMPWLSLVGRGCAV